MYRIVTLYGTVLDPEKWRPYYVIDVLPDLGDAAEFGLAGQVRIHERQIKELHLNYDEGQEGPGKDIVRLPEHIARSLGKDDPPSSNGRDTGRRRR